MVPGLHHHTTGCSSEQNISDCYSTLPGHPYLVLDLRRKAFSLLALSMVLAGSSQVALVMKNPPVNAEVLRDAGLIPGSGRFPGGRHGNPLQYSCLENPTNRGAWWAQVHRVAQSRT